MALSPLFSWAFLEDRNGFIYFAIPQIPSMEPSICQGDNVGSIQLLS